MRLKIRVLTFLLIVSLNANAEDLGTFGPTYKILETNLLDYIYSRLNQYKVTGMIDILEKQYIEVVKNDIENPKGINLAVAPKNNTWFFDPSLKLTKDILNEKGDVIAYRNTVINPLKYASLRYKMLFINATNVKEIAYAKMILAKEPNSKVILTKGNIEQANRELSIAVYFDQGSKLVKRFGLRYTPSVITQSNHMLEIREVSL